MLGRFLTTKQVAALLGVSGNTLATWIHRRHMPSPGKFGDSLAWSERDIAAARRLLAVRGPKARALAASAEEVT
jgi:excisionase family DNA binding protein